MARPAYRNRNLQNGVTMARERTDDWMQMAKDLARAERELQIEHWVYTVSYTHLTLPTIA